MHRYALLLIALAPLTALADPVGEGMQATTANGDRIMLHPNGRWQYVDERKAAEASKAFAQFPEIRDVRSAGRVAISAWGAASRPGTRISTAPRA